MQTLIVGAGATGGYMGSKLIAAGRDVTFLAHESTAERLRREGLRIRRADGRVTDTPVEVLTRDQVSADYDVVLLAVRAGAVAAAAEDIAPAVGADTVVVPVVNGMAHLTTLVTRFGVQRVSGGAARLSVSMDHHGVIAEVAPDVALQIGSLVPTARDAISTAQRELDVDGMVTSVADDIVTAMWVKFSFITSAAALTCLLRNVVGVIASTPWGAAVAEQVVAEVSAVATADGHALPESAVANLRTVLTDGGSRFAPSMFRDLTSGRPVETDALDELIHRARRHGLGTPLVDAARAVIELQSRDFADGDPGAG